MTAPAWVELQAPVRQHHVTYTIIGAEPLPIPYDRTNRLFSPGLVRACWIDRFDGKGWQLAKASLVGPKLLKSGKASTELSYTLRVTEVDHRTPDLIVRLTKEAPDWLADALEEWRPEP